MSSFTSNSSITFNINTSHTTPPTTSTALEKLKAQQNVVEREISILNAQLQSLLSDPLLGDLPKDATIDEVNVLIAQEQGTALTIYVRKLDGTCITCHAKDHNATVRDLKNNLQRKIAHEEEKHIGNRRISWKYVWKNYCLTFGQTRLLDDNVKLVDYGLENHSELHFARYYKRRKQR